MTGETLFELVNKQAGVELYIREEDDPAPSSAASAKLYSERRGEEGIAAHCCRRQQICRQGSEDSQRFQGHGDAGEQHDQGEDIRYIHDQMTMAGAAFFERVPASGQRASLRAQGRARQGRNGALNHD